MRSKKEPLDELVSTIKRLLGKKGCPWDRKQTLSSMAKHIIEECYELVEEVKKKDRDGIKEELGDLFFLAIFMMELAEKEYKIKDADVISGVNEKLIRRHPHVFGAIKVKGEGDVLKNWERLKNREKDGRSALAGVPASLPALLKAFRMQEKASRIGFDWTGPESAAEKIDEEAAEFRRAVRSKKKEKIIEEYGDMLFTFVNVARHLGIESEEALQKANGKFLSRFKKMERAVKKDGKELSRMTIEEQEKYWQKIK